ncbi:hypothetical protein DFH05DRAFT_899700 [Lentinula detonsa]|uniref:Uncharacterized protein n=1 Tax=Lentinula detonsa TaxID=2804962 RepID=A0A9W8NPP5_9AGAR|nr:hypothetical protein DFH05DRAFT_899700 [Lentinula detonsa]
MAQRFVTLKPFLSMFRFSREHFFTFLLQNLDSTAAQHILALEQLNSRFYIHSSIVPGDSMDFWSGLLYFRFFLQTFISNTGSIKYLIYINTI